ncbi:unnamed protein product [Vicia faba]|uniref:Uncharacterized protein n=1 Tax=Vicia faba TaxID=3906 RepID=A0AAV1ALI7_VICFA|nr:unnamed protein product [Vicia faba]
MSFNNFKGGVTNKGKEILMKKVISEEDFMGIHDLSIDKDNMESQTNMSEQMFQHLSQEFESSLKNDFRLKFGSIRYHHGEYSQGTNLRNPDDAEVDIGVAHDDVVNNHDHDLEYVKTRSKSVNEIHCTKNGKDCRFISNDENVDLTRVMDEKSASLNKDLNMETEDILCANRMKRTHDKYHVVKLVQAIGYTNKDDDLCIHMLKRKDLEWIDHERDTPKEGLTIE